MQQHYWTFLYCSPYTLLTLKWLSCFISLLIFCISSLLHFCIGLLLLCCSLYLFCFFKLLQHQNLLLFLTLIGKGQSKTLNDKSDNLTCRKSNITIAQMWQELFFTSGALILFSPTEQSGEICLEGIWQRWEGGVIWPTPL